MRPTSLLWRKYKDREADVFKMVYSDQGKPKPENVGKLVQGISDFLQSCGSSKQRDEIHSHIRSSLLLRKESWELYLILHENAENNGNRKDALKHYRSLRGHANYFKMMNKILPSDLQIEMPAKWLTQHSTRPMETHVPNSPEYSASRHLEYDGKEETCAGLEKPLPDAEPSYIDEEEFGIFCAAIIVDLEEILRLWSDLVRKEIKPFAFTAGIDFLCDHIKSCLEGAQLVSPHWFSMEYLTRTYHPFQLEQQILIQPEIRPTEYEFLNSVIGSVVSKDGQLPRDIVPKYFLRMVRSCSAYLENGGGFHAFESSRRLIELRVEVHRDLDLFREVLSHPNLKCFPELSEDDNFSPLIAKLQGVAPKLKDFSLLSSISLWCYFHLHQVLWQFLESPLITMTAHLFVYRKLTGANGRQDMLERICQKHADLLYWKGRQPSTLEEWHTSYTNWVIPVKSSAAKIAKARSTRLQRKYSLGDMVENQLKASIEIRLGGKSALQSGADIKMWICKLQEYVPYDTISIYDEVRRITLPLRSRSPNFLALEKMDPDAIVAWEIYRHIGNPSSDGANVNSMISEIMEATDRTAKATEYYKDA